MVKVLLVTPKLSVPGGVSEFNKMLLNYSSSLLKPFFLFGAGHNQNAIFKSIAFLLNIIRFFLVIAFTSSKIVHLNPSLGSNAVVRDGIFCFIAKLFKKKVYIHWHGWNPDNEYLLEGKSLGFVKKTLFKADHIKFLSSSFSKLFVEKGFSNITSLGNTFIDDSLLDGYEIIPDIKPDVNILFLSTISKNKGIYLTVELFAELVQDYNITLTIAGNGPELEGVNGFLSNDIRNKVFFTGHITGQDKMNAYKNADIYLFPSQYEGMPTSVLEAMGFGLPIICSAVGALPDFFENEKMGFIVNKDDKGGFKLALKGLIEDKSFREQVSVYNHNYAKEHFLASKAIEKIDADYLNLV